MLYSNNELRQAFESICFDFLVNNLINEYNKIKENENMVNGNITVFDSIMDRVNSFENK